MKCYTSCKCNEPRAAIPLFPPTSQLQVNHKLSNPNGWTPAPEKQTLTGNFYQVSITPTSSPAFFHLAPPDRVHGGFLLPTSKPDCGLGNAGTTPNHKLRTRVQTAGGTAA
jgi:hypothetical protein